MKAQFADILAKKTEVEEHLINFSKTFQKQLSFIAMKVRQDASQLSKLWSYCLVCCHSIKDKSKINSEEQRKLNKPFFEVFQLMTAPERESYLLQLLNMIGSLVKAQEKKLNPEKKEDGDLYVKELREELVDELEEIYLDPAINLKRVTLTKQTFYARTICDEVQAYKNVKIDRWLLLLVEHINKKEVIQRIDIRNYLLLKHEDARSFTLMSIFEVVVPKTVELEFLETNEKEQMENYLQEVVKIGKIQRLVSHYNIEILLFGERMLQLPKKKEIFSNEMLELNTETDIVFQNQPFKEVLSPRLTKRSLKRQQTQVSYYNEMKRTIVTALNELAAKKHEQNKRIREFKYKINKPIKKSEKLIQAANNQEAKISRTKHQKSYQTAVDHQIVEEAILRIAGIETHVIASPAQLKKQQSFLSQEDAPSRGDDHQRKISMKKKTTLSFHENIYKALYPDYHLKFFNDLSEYREVELNKSIWVEPELKENQNKSKSIQNILEKEALKESTRVYEHRNLSHKFKIIIKIVADLKTLVLSLTNIQAWPKWHPNISKIDLLSKNLDENSCDILLSCQKNKVDFQCCLRVHLFRVDKRCFLVFKSLENPNEKDKKRSFLNLLGINSKTKDRTYDYLLFTIQTYGSKGNNVQISIDFEINGAGVSKGSQIRQQQATFFINFFFITSFWKVDWKEDGQSDVSKQLEELSKKNLFDQNWKIEYSNYSEIPLLQRVS